MPKAKEVVAKFKIGDRVKFVNEGEETEGTITAVDEKAKEADVEADGLSDVLVCEFDEMTVIPKSKGKPKEKETEDDPEENPKGKKTGKKSLKGSFNSKPPADPRGLGIPPGNHEALIVEGLAATTDKGTSVYLQFVAVSGEVDGQSSRRFYPIYDDEGNPQDSISYLKTDLIMLGLMDEDTEIDDSSIDSVVDELNKILKKLKKMQPWVSIRVQEKGGFTNIYLQQLMDDQDEKPALPDKD